MNQIEQFGEWQLTGGESYGGTDRLWPLSRFATVSLSQGRASGLHRQAAIRKHEARNSSNCGRKRPLVDSGRIRALLTLRELTVSPIEAAARAES